MKAGGRVLHLLSYTEDSCRWSCLMAPPRALTAALVSGALSPCVAASSLGLCSVPSITMGFSMLVAPCCLHAHRRHIGHFCFHLCFKRPCYKPCIPTLKSADSGYRAQRSWKVTVCCMKHPGNICHDRSPPKQDLQGERTGWQPERQGSCRWRAAAPSRWPTPARLSASG